MPDKIGPQKPFVHFIAEHRLKNGLTQKQLSERLGCDVMTVSRWERYETEVTMPTLAAIAEALYGDLMEGEDLLHHPDRPTPNQLMRQLAQDDRNFILKQIKTLSKQA
jgi:transcriptional regulator with XRE-family HTH domain